MFFIGTKILLNRVRALTSIAHYEYRECPVPIPEMFILKMFFANVYRLNRRGVFILGNANFHRSLWPSFLWPSFFAQERA